MDSDAHRVVAALTHDDSAGKGLVVNFNVECPVSAIQSVLLDKVQVVYTSNLCAEKTDCNRHAILCKVATL